MKLPIKTSNKTYYLVLEEWEKEKQFIKDQEIEFTENVRKFWNSLNKLKC